MLEGRVGKLAAAAAFAALLACGGARKQAPVAVNLPPAPAPGPVEPGNPPDIPPNPRTKPSPIPGRDAVPVEPAPGKQRPPTAPGDVEKLYEAHVYRDAHGAKLPYRLYRPKLEKGAGKRPLILLLHGSSARGTDNVKQLAASYGASFWASPAVQRIESAYIVAPQADPKYAPTWVRAWRAPPNPDPKRPEPLEMALELVKKLETELPIDPQRLYVVGYSMGGFGAWIAIGRHPELFAAAAPISGGGDPSQVDRTKTAVWAFHGTDDRSVPVTRSREMVEAIKEAGGDIRYTEFPGAGHEIWDQVWSQPGLASWLFSHRSE